MQEIALPWEAKEGPYAVICTHQTNKQGIFKLIEAAIVFLRSQNAALAGLKVANELRNAAGHHIVICSPEQLELALEDSVQIVVLDNFDSYWP